MNFQEEKTWAMLAHLSALVGLLFSGTSFILGVIGPLIIWLMKKDQSPLIAEHAKEALNFNISFAIYSVIAALTIAIFIGIILVPAVFIVWIVLIIIATVKSNNNELYRYPLIIRFIK